MKIWFFAFIYVSVISCRTPDKYSFEIPENVQISLDSSGDNKVKLLKVIEYYRKKKDTLKLRAAFFLIANMREHYYYQGDGVTEYRKVFKKMDSLLLAGGNIFHHTWDSIQKNNLPPDLNTVKSVIDLRKLSAEYLIHNIEKAFDAWNYPWARNLSFDEFCEYLLPYKMLNEEPDSWKETVQHNFRWLLDSFPNENDTRKICSLINDSLKSKFMINARFDCSWNINYSDLMTLHTGKCSHGSQLAAYTMRAMGLPVVMDHTPFWANKGLGHEWNALLIKGKPFFFVGTESNPGKNKIVFTRPDWMRRKRAKVYRRTFSIQANKLFLSKIDKSDKPSYLNDCHYTDVTKQYVPVSDISLQLNGTDPKARFAYLCVFNNLDWHPIDFAEIDRSSGVTFKNMGRDIVYLPMYYRHDRLSPAGWPFELSRNGELRPLVPDTSATELVTVKKKYPEDKSNNIQPGENYELLYWKGEWISLEVQKAKTDSLVFRNVFKNSLLWVRDLDKGKQERIFTYRSGTQIWW